MCSHFIKIDTSPEDKKIPPLGNYFWYCFIHNKPSNKAIAGGIIVKPVDCTEKQTNNGHKDNPT